MADTRTSMLLSEEDPIGATSCATWQQIPERRVAHGFQRAAGRAGIAFLLVGSSMTGMADPWQADDRRRSAVVSAQYLTLRQNRRVSLADARRLALAVIRRADEERLEVARRDAAAQIYIGWGS